MFCVFLKNLNQKLHFCTLSIVLGDFFPCEIPVQQRRIHGRTVMDM